MIRRFVSREATALTAGKGYECPSKTDTVMEQELQRSIQL